MKFIDLKNVTTYNVIFANIRKCNIVMKIHMLITISSEKCSLFATHIAKTACFHIVCPINMHVKLLFPIINIFLKDKQSCFDCRGSQGFRWFTKFMR